MATTSRRLATYLDGVHIGEVRQDTQGTLTFS